MERIGGRLGAAYTLDKEWVDATDKRAAQVRLATQLPNLLRLLRPGLTPAAATDAGATGRRVQRQQGVHGEGARPSLPGA